MDLTRNEYAARALPEQRDALREDIRVIGEFRVTSGSHLLFTLRKSLITDSVWLWSPVASWMAEELLECLAPFHSPERYLSHRALSPLDDRYMRQRWMVWNNIDNELGLRTLWDTWRTPDAWRR